MGRYIPTIRERFFRKICKSFSQDFSFVKSMLKQKHNTIE